MHRSLLVPVEGGRGRRGRGKENGEEYEDSAHSRPSGPATLFDFLETKIPVKDGEKPCQMSVGLPVRCRLSV